MPAFADAGHTSRIFVAGAPFPAPVCMGLSSACPCSRCNRCGPRRTCMTCEREQTGVLLPDPGRGLDPYLDRGLGPAGPSRPCANHLYPLSCSSLLLLLIGTGFACGRLTAGSGGGAPGPGMRCPAGAKLFGPLQVLVDANREMPDDCVRHPHSALNFGYFGPGTFDREDYIVAVFEFLDRVGQTPAAHAVDLSHAGALVGCNFAKLIYQRLDVGLFNVGRNDEQYFIHSH